MSAYIQANTNGRLHSAAEPSLPVLNRGFLYGDAIYEVWRTYAGVIFGWEGHLERLDRSAAALQMALPLDRASLLVEIRRTVEAFRTETSYAGDVYIRLQIFRGAGPIGLDPALADAPGYVLIVQKCPNLSEAQLEGGLRLSIARTLHRNSPGALNPAWKTGNYLNNLLCLSEARSRGADEVVIPNALGEVTEAAVMNLAFVKGDRVVTPRAEAGILLGITRSVLLSTLRTGPGWTISEAAVRVDELGDFDECFLLATTRDIIPVRAIDDHQYRLGAATVTRRLKEAFARHVEDYNLRNAYLKV